MKARTWAVAVAVLLAAGALVGEASADDLFVSCESGQVLRLDGQSGQVLAQYGQGGVLVSPLGFALSDNNSLFVGDFVAEAIVAYDLGAPGVDPRILVAAGQGYGKPHGLAMGRDGDLYAACFQEHAINSYDSLTGELRRTIPLPQNLRDLHDIVLHGEDLYVSSYADSAITRIDLASGQSAGYFVQPGSGGLDDAQAFEWGPDGDLYVVSNNTNQVLKFDGSTGDFISVFISAGTGLAGPRGLAFGPDGDLYVSSGTTNEILRYDGATGTALGVFASGLGSPWYLEFSPVPEPATLSLLAIGGLVMLRRQRIASLVIVVSLIAMGASSAAMANVFDMGLGLTSLETVPVGNAANAGELSGDGAGGWGSNRICGAVDYEYNIGKYEVTAGQYCEFLNAVASIDTHGLYNTHMDVDVDFYGCGIKRDGVAGAYSYSVSQDRANRPANFVSFGDAMRFANWLHNEQPNGSQCLGTTEEGAYSLNGETNEVALLKATRRESWKWAVTSEDEWYKAAYYDPSAGQYFDYATGSNNLPANDIVSPDPGNSANYYRSWANDLTLGYPYFYTEAGEFENSPSPYGTFDQSGNIWEWNEAVIDAWWAEPTAAAQWRGVRGGAWDIYESSALVAAYRFCYDPTLTERSNFGFRIVQVPEPATVSLLALGGMAALRRRK